VKFRVATNTEVSNPHPSSPCRNSDMPIRTDIEFRQCSDLLQNCDQLPMKFSIFLKTAAEDTLFVNKTPLTEIDEMPVVDR
jgi:hypothetical protein